MSPQLFWLHHQTPAAKPLCLPRLCVPGVYETSGPERGVSKKMEQEPGEDAGHGQAQGHERVGHDYRLLERGAVWT